MYLFGQNITEMKPNEQKKKQTLSWKMARRENEQRKHQSKKINKMEMIEVCKRDITCERQSKTNTRTKCMKTKKKECVFSYQQDVKKRFYAHKKGKFPVCRLPRSFKPKFCRRW